MSVDTAPGICANCNWPWHGLPRINNLGDLLCPGSHLYDKGRELYDTPKEHR